jgi:hypothetical protein
VETDLHSIWKQLVEAVGRARPLVKTYLSNAGPLSLSNNVLTVGFDSEFADQMLLVDNTTNHELFQSKLAELGHPRVRVKFVKADISAPRTAPAPPEPTVAPGKLVPEVQAAQPAKAAGPLNKDDFKNDPLIRKALEIFKGQISEVRS